jgi:hypothetical protein
MTSNDPGGTAYPPPASRLGVPDYAPAYPAPSTTPPPEAAPGLHNDRPDGEPSTADVAKNQAATVASGAADAAKDVAGTVKEQASQVTAEAGKQVRQLWGQAQSELTEQASTQQQRLAGGLRDLGDQLRSMAQRSDQSGVAVDVAHQAADKAHQVADWFDNRDPGSVLNEVRRFARQRPGTFLAIAVGAGLVAGRLARNLAADPDELAAGNADSQVHVDDARRTQPSGQIGYQPAVQLPPAAADLPAGMDPKLYGSGQVPDWTGKSAEEWSTGR